MVNVTIIANKVIRFSYVFILKTDLTKSGTTLNGKFDTTSDVYYGNLIC